MGRVSISNQTKDKYVHKYILKSNKTYHINMMHKIK